MTRHLRPHWPRIARRVARADRLAVFADFDGTLAPIRQHPGAVRLSERAGRALSDLAAAGHAVAIISGRSIDDLRTRVNLAGLWYVGDHGFCVRSPRGRTLNLVRQRATDSLDRATRELTAEVGSMAGVSVERKDATVAVHYRRASQTNRDRAAAVVTRVARRARGLRLMAGKRVWELLPDESVDKAMAARLILHAEHRRHPDAVVVPIFLGDDVTDEDMFRLGSGVSIAVGAPGPTAAEFRLRSPADVCTLLERLVHR